VRYASSSTLLGRLRGRRAIAAPLLAVAALVLITAVDYFVVPQPDVAFTLYAIPVLIAALFLQPPAVGTIAVLATALNVLSCVIQRPSLEAAAWGVVGLALLDLLGVLLALQRSQAEQARKRMQEVTGFVTHDLRGPLTRVAGYVGVLRRELRRDEAPDRTVLLEHLAAVADAADELNAMVDELMDAARLQEGRSLDLRLQPTDLVQLAATCAEDWQRQAPRHTVRATSSLPELVGNWDVQRLRRVLNNLLSNATKFSPDGGLVLVAVTSDSDGAEHWAVMTVQDFGQGIPQADVPRVFDRFHRGANAAGRIAGTGLGLAGVREIVREHGGTIVLASEEGKGTAVTVRLPLETEPEPAAAGAG
jgi:signal transduction histidine kinase